LDTENSNQFLILLFQYVKGKLKNRNMKKCLTVSCSQIQCEEVTQCQMLTM